MEEYENARELYNSLLGVLLDYSQCNFEIRILKKKAGCVYGSEIIKYKDIYN